MKKFSILLLSSCAALAQAPQQGKQAKAPPQPMSFFVASAGSGKGADLGGLAGADQHCQMLAQGVGSSYTTWHAYLSTQAADGKPAVNARDRIGQGPWYNQKGQMVARNLSDLHGDTLEAARLGNNLTKATAFTEKVQRGEATLYRARFAGLEPNQAEAACKSLKRSGFDCFATRN